MANAGWPQGEKELMFHHEWKNEVHMEWTILGFREWLAQRPAQLDQLAQEQEDGRCPF